MLIEDHVGEDELRGTNKTHKIEEKNAYKIFVRKS